ncbi:Uncharacterised protein [Salmonella enterica subsp. enterica]|nr:Uncharacterised protein [Salmonella enterica subsp. enterica]
MKNIVPDYRLDMVGEPCPYPAGRHSGSDAAAKKRETWKW